MHAARLMMILALMAAPSLARAQDTVTGVQADLSQVLGQMEGNLVTRDAIEMNSKVWRSNAEALTARAKDLAHRIEEANAYCQGTFEEPEYQRRLAYCNSLDSQLESQKAQMIPESDALEAQRLELQRRETERETAWTGLEGTLSTILPRLIALCATMTPAEQALSCRMPTAPGPRTADMINEMNATLAGVFTK